MRIDVARSNCPRCFGTGKIFAKVKEEQNGIHYTNLFRCDCGTGRQLPYNWPLWDSKLTEKYFVDFISVSGKQLSL